ncbi:MAG: DNA polymerase IV [Clostridia bacterium]|nr:DNA polymerase IV [Clostridia bacterium]
MSNTFGERTILHCDCNSYYASVESIDRPELKDVPMAVCGDPDSRHGIILAKNEEAKKYGIKTAETIFSAKRKCPHLVLVPSHHEKYAYYCEKINTIYLDYTDQVERFSVDESWLDVTGSLHLYGTGKEIADEIRRRVREEIGITVSVGVSFNKVFAKLGSDYKKPDATTVISKENYKDILFCLPVQDMLFVGKSAAKTLNSFGILTIGDIVKSGRETMSRLLGRAGESIWENASGLDMTPVKKYDEEDGVKSVGNSITFARNLVGKDDVHAGLTMLCDSVGARLRKQGLFCTTVQIQIRDPNFQTIQRQKTLNTATNSTRALFENALDIFKKCYSFNSPIRLLGVTASGLTTHATVQMSLLDEGEEEASEKNTRLDKTVDEIRSRFGKNTISFANTIRTDIVKENKNDSE